MVRSKVFFFLYSTSTTTTMKISCLINLLTIIIGVSEARLFDYKEESQHVQDSSDSSQEYSINDIVRRHRSLTQTTRHEVEIFKNPKYDTSCIKKALTPILPKCLKVNIDTLDPELRAVTAAKLSICEFEVAKISYPNECYPRRYFFSSDEDSIDYEDCILALEKSPQWWTSYSGNYRAIGDICFQESLPYEKDEILNLFLNVTEIYEKILEDLNENIEMSTSFKQSSKKSFEELKNFMDEVLIKFQKDSDDQKTQYGDKLKEMNKILEETAALTKILSNSTVGVTDVVINQIQTLENKWDGFFNQYNNDEFMNEVNSMKEYFINDLESRDFKINLLLDDFIDNLNKIATKSDINLQLSKDLESSLGKNIEDSTSLNRLITKAGDSIIVSSEYASNLLETFTQLDQLNINEILNVSERELLEIFQRITNELNNEMIKVHGSAKTLDEELIVLVDRIGEATGSLVTINDILKNNIFIKLLMFVTSNVSILANKFVIIGISILVYYFLLVVKFKLVSKNMKILTLLFFTSVGGIILGISVVRCMKMFLNSKSSLVEL